MNIWLVTIGETLPIEPGNARLLRAGLLADLLADANHRVTWWTSNFNHWLKHHRFPGDHVVEVRPNYTMRLLHGCGYNRNVSLARLIDHWQMARKFRAQSRALAERPDVILCSFPPIELSAEAVRYGREFSVPVALDVRDLWPDIFINLVPAPARPLAKAALRPYFRMTRDALLNATAILAINEPFLQWGLDRAGRSATPLDRAFPMAYPSREPSAAEQRQAVEFWQARDVTENDGSFKVIFAGTLGRQFQFEPIIEVAKALTGSNIRFVLCGTGDRFNYVQSLTRGLPNVLLPGWVGAAQIWTLMRMAHAGLAPYHDEESFTHSLPNKSLEYLSAGLPIVSSLPGALARLLAERRCGLTYPNLDARSLRVMLETLHDQPDLRAEMARNAQATYNSGFRAEVVYARMITHLEQIAHSNATVVSQRSR
jgi:glycosyltransferase involved in cell wall biosynthesis